SVRATPLFSDQGKPVGQVGTVEDITERKRTAEALRWARDEFEARVEERTAELTTAIQLLEDEISERKALERELKAYADTQSALLKQFMNAKEQVPDSHKERPSN